MFKVLILAYYFPPMGLSGVQRTLKFAKYLSNYNWEPTVITAGETGYFAHDSSLMKEAEQSGIRIIRTKSVDPNSLLKKYGTIKMPSEWLRKLINRISKVLFIPDNKLFWSRAAYKKAAELLEKEHFDVIYVTIPPFSIFTEAIRLKNKFDIPVVVDYRDLWNGNQYSFNISLYHKYRHKKLEEYALHNSDRIIVVNRKIKEHLLTSFPFLRFDDISIINHGFDQEDFDNNIEYKKENNKLLLTYAGIFYEGITPEYLLRAYKLLENERPDIAANIVLQFIGLFRKENLKLVKKLNLENSVIISNYLNHNEVISKLKSSDVLWLTLREKGMENVTPGKLFEYFGARKPIFGSLSDGVAKTNLLEYKACFVSSVSDLNEIKNTLIEIANLYKNNTLPVPDDNFVERFSREYQTELLTKELQFLLKEDLD